MWRQSIWPPVLAAALVACGGGHDDATLSLPDPQPAAAKKTGSGPQYQTPALNKPPVPARSRASQLVQ